MWTLNQIKSQTKQLLLFYRFFPLGKVFKDTLLFPFEYHNSSGRAGFPWAINFIVTSACNLNCRMCNFKALRGSDTNNELSADEIKDFFKREHKKKFHVFLTGGEPFMRKDIFEIIETIRHFGLTWGICTNGTLLNEVKVKELMTLGAKYIMFSLHGPEAVHDGITGVSGSFRKLLENMEIAVSFRSRNKVKIFVNCAVNDSNLNHLIDVVHIAENAGVDMLRFEHLNFLTRSEIENNRLVCEKRFPGERITPSSHSADHSMKNWGDYCESIARITRQKSKFRIPVHFKPFLSSSEIRYWYSDCFAVDRRCVFVWKSLFINPRGDVIPCQFLIYKLGNIRTESLEEIWNSEKYRRLRLCLKSNLLPGCSRCCKL